ncbi:hypothetical protein QJS83_04150 [Bdellovibrio sp. 22V]|uniref:hypothetical protein n=1 Tax=Bdellovibrio TaxID=958 RepID=UPI002543AE7C|nr:hypothetical protein [Bdellovibrio sp. 22V]WII73064.1 hypothetical protein QJS83_04150 [Bdellovibrio sp. 22V]
MSMLIGILMMMGLAHAEGPQTCPDIYERREGTKIQQIWSDASYSCFFTVTPQDAYVDLEYRDHLFASNGLFMVFNSFGPGDESKTTGAREFFMFPRPNDRYSYKWNDEANELEVVHVTGDTFVFDIKKARLKSVTRANVTVADYVVPSNRGGIEISNYQGILLDSGFTLGRSPTSNANAYSTFKDFNGKTCRMKNSELFKYTSDGEIIFKYSDKSLKALLNSRCPQLSLP